VEEGGGQAQLFSVEGQPTAVVPIASVLAPDSPRLAGENDEHTRLLAGSEDRLPPIIVNRSTMRVIDGAHRLSAALLRGENEIEVCFFDGAEEDAFMLAVVSNIRHGLPLSLADRTVATARIIASHPHWSDRAIAATTGLTPKTVAAIRRRSTDTIPHLRTRVGRDGRCRPLDISEGRRRACELIKANPDVSLRQVAAKAGVSQGTARDVRNRMRRGESPVPTHRTRRQVRSEAPKPEESPPVRSSGRDRGLLLRNLRKDPSLRFNEAGRTLIRMLDFCVLEEKEQARLLETVPSHCVETVAELAYECAQTWQAFAQHLMEHRPSQV
jgi:ParB-like chromosome segregation protein Spo0J